MFKSKLVKAIIFIQIGLTALVALTAVVSLLYAKEMGNEAIWQTLKGLFTVWLMCLVIFGFLPLLICYIRYKLSTKEKVLIFSGELAQTLPVWTMEQGLSDAFIEKYEITPREKEVIEIMMHGKTDKEISIKLNLAVNTVQVHLKRIYRKTGAAGRFALSSLIRGEK